MSTSTSYRFGMAQSLSADGLSFSGSVLGRDQLLRRLSEAGTAPAHREGRG